MSVFNVCVLLLDLHVYLDEISEDVAKEETPS